MGLLVSPIDWNNPRPEYWRGVADAYEAAGQYSLPPGIAANLRLRAANARAHAQSLVERAAAAPSKPVQDPPRTAGG